MLHAMRLQSGKLPVKVLRGLLRWRGAADPSVIVGPAFGEDAAVIEMGRTCLVLKSDPVTFTGNEIGWYAVHVNANDVAVMGARPRWFQSSIILPEGSTAALALGIVRDIHRAARSLDIAVTGGHTEVSAAVRQPIVAGDMQGLVSRDRLVRSDGARPDDLLLMVGWAGIEGTAIIARERAGAARRLLGDEGYRQAVGFHRRPGISIVREATIAAARRVSSMHDPTEGGVAAGIYEMASASGVRFEIDLDAVTVHPHTHLLCRHFDLRALGLISSGALLVTASPRRAKRLLAALAGGRKPARVIGRVTRGRGVQARRGGRRVRFVWSERDELTRLP